VPRPVQMSGEPAFKTIDRVRALPSLVARSETGQITYHDTPEEVVQAQKTRFFECLNTYPDRYEYPPNSAGTPRPGEWPAPTRQLSETQVAQLNRLAYLKFEKPFEVEEEEEES